MMEQVPKRRVLSLSLSQPSKQHKKLRLKQNTSTSSEAVGQNPLSNTCEENRNSRIGSSSPLSQPKTSRQHRTDVGCGTIISNEDKSLSFLNQCNSIIDTCENFNDDDTRMKSRSTDFDLNHKSDIFTEKDAKGGCNTSSTSLICGGDFEKDMSKTIYSSEVIFDEEMKQSQRREERSFSLTNARDRGEIPSLQAMTNTNPEADKPSEPNKLLKSSPNKTLASTFPISENACGERKTNISDAASCADQSCAEVLQCPLCYKNFEKLVSKNSHLKSCASKHKLSTHQLLEALDLQRKQAAERKALGLPVIPSGVGNSKKSSAPKKENRSSSKMDGNLQLAMALSLSLKDQEQAIEESRKNDVMSLDHFGFKKKPTLDTVRPQPTSSTSGGKTKETQRKMPPLLTRTAEDRQRIITEKVAIVLLEDMASGNKESSQSFEMKSTFLQECQNKDNLLWAKSHVSPSKSDRGSFYVSSLQGFISPSKVDVGSKVLHLSQVVGRPKTPTKNLKKQGELEMVLLSSPSEEEVLSDSRSPQLTEPKTVSQIEMELRAKLFNDWAGMVNNPSMSDLAIYPKEGREIPAHKIVLHVRCPRIFRDITRQRNTLTGNEVEVIMWTKTPHAAALAFLEYVYCGSVKSIRVLCEDLSSIFWLANHYRVSDLLRYLTVLTHSSRTVETPSQVALNVLNDDDNILCFPYDSQENRVNSVSETNKDNCASAVEAKLTNRSLSNQVPIVTDEPGGSTSRSETESIYSEVTLCGPDNNSMCSSPDMFGDEDIVEAPEKCLENSISVWNTSTRQKSEKGCDRDRRPTSRAASISSDKTVVIEKNTSSTPEFDITHLDRGGEPPSPALSQASAVTELLDFRNNECVVSSALNDSKRKLSDSSKDESKLASKRQCPISPNIEAPSDKKDSDVEFCDLTQDSDSNGSFPVIKNNFSGESSDKVVILSEHEMSETESHQGETKSRSELSTEIKDNLEGSVSKVCSKLSAEQSAEKDADVSLVSLEMTGEGYVSPVWDGFEDINYDFHDPLLYPQLPVSDITPDEENRTSRQLSPLKRSCPTPGKDQVQSLSKASILNKNNEVREVHESKTSTSSDCEVTSDSPVKIKTGSFSTASNLEALLDDSFQINDTILQQAESGLPGVLSQRDAKGTPVNRIMLSDTDNVTPLANYSAMKTPQLKRELQKFGLKPTLGKRKGKIMLRHIYNELHPWVPVESGGLRSSEHRVLSQPSCSNTVVRQTLSCSQPNSRKLKFTSMVELNQNADKNFCDEFGNTESDSNSDDGDEKESVNTTSHEIRFLESDCSDSEVLSQVPSQPVTKANLSEVFSEFLRNDREFHQKVLEYEPIGVEKLQSDLKRNGHKFKMADLMSFLDEKCITFRTNQTGPRTKKRKQRAGNLVQKTGDARQLDNVEVSD